MVKSAAVTRLDRQIALVLAAVVIGLLVRATPLDLLPGDAGEFQFAAWAFGLAHATGYPLYLLAGGAWQHLWALVGVAPALSLNILSAVFAGAAAPLFYLRCRWMPAPGRPASGGYAGNCLFRRQPHAAQPGAASRGLHPPRCAADRHPLGRAGRDHSGGCTPHAARLMRAASLRWRFCSAWD
ncbi:MAG: DUF2723 domain-containing protein [Anaerolineales bacterium]|nr:DUF2723 domain-containing protein [Anaerolineales bacterium]